MKTSLLLLILSVSLALAQNPSLDLQWKGQASLIHASSLSGSFDVSPTTLRYIPQLRLDYQMNSTTRLGFDAAIDLYSHALGATSITTNGDLYRFTMRYDTPRTQVRVGLQKINFGPARMLRVLQWFDQLDPRDPLALSPGVWAGMGRYYFENGANIRLWTMVDTPEPMRDYWGDKSGSPWDMGGRLEYPVPAGTLGLTLHSMDVTRETQVTENRLAVDARFDAIVGLWSELVYSRTKFGIADPINSVTAMAGVDYTFGVGNGLYIALESLTSHTSNGDGNLLWVAGSTALMGTYTLGLADGLTAYLYAINFPHIETQYIPMLGWQHTRGNWLYYLALYDMPEMEAVGSIALPTGTGIQFNIAFNH